MPYAILEQMLQDQWDEDARTLLLPLARAQGALARLEATAAAASAAVQEGLRARLAFREAAGWLAHQGHWIHPIDLALRDAGLTGSYAAARLGQRLPSVLPATTRATAAEGAAEDVPEDQDIALALTVARLWRRLGEQRTWRPLESPEALAAALAPLGEGGPAAALSERLQLLWPPAFAEAKPLRLRAGRSPDLPPLVIAGTIARDWQDAGRRDRLSLAGVFLAACVWQAQGTDGRGDGLPLWSAPVQRLHRLALQPRRGWLALFLGAVADAAQQAGQELARLQRAEARAAGLARTVRSRLPEAAVLALRRPIVTARLLAAALGVSHRAALGLAGQLQAAGVIREATGRAAWRAFAVA
jgi:hypothetical protein